MAKPKYEGSPLDKKRDAAAAKKAGKTPGQWEDTATDKRMDKAGQAALDAKTKAKAGPRKKA
ncbi:MAG TPA: hypothetical protein VMV33_17155 [Rhodocyclaceae bacterium]|nr:hypothetical protein [Rhodocyclaceae bacterium]